MNYRFYLWRDWIKWGVVILVILILAVAAVSTYNGLASADQDVRSKWSQVENVMQRRADLISNGVEIVKGYVRHEEKVFGDIAAARAVLYNDAFDIQSKLDADSQMVQAARSMVLLVENYPDLKAGEQFKNLQVQLEGAENRISVERKRFIDSVQVYNTKISRFPANVLAKFLGFAPKEYFKTAPGAQEAPKIKF